MQNCLWVWGCRNLNGQERILSSSGGVRLRLEGRWSPHSPVLAGLAPSDGQTVEECAADSSHVLAGAGACAGAATGVPHPTPLSLLGSPGL